MKITFDAIPLTAEKMTGWVQSPRMQRAEEHSMLLWAGAFDPKNPLYNDPEYAKNTRWGGLISAPLYQECFTLTTWNAPLPEGLGGPSHGYAGVPFMLGEEWEFTRPIRPGEFLRAYRHKPTLTKDDSDDSDGIHRFTFMSHDVDLIDESGEAIARSKCYLRMWLSHFKAEPKAPHDPVYTKERLAEIQRIYENEELRGAVPRFIEDVQVGNVLTPAVLGPTTVWDMVVMTVGRQDQKLLPMQELRSQPNGPSVPDPVTGVSKCFMECHLANDTAHTLGLPNAIHAGAVDRSLLVRIVSNWMGDDGFITSFHWQPLRDTYVGDTLFASGVVESADAERGECLLSLALHNQVGEKTAAAQVRVRLPKRD